MLNGEVDTEQVKQMVDLFLANGFNYFDTAHPYIRGKSELAIRECLTSRYPRESYVLTNKLSDIYFNSREDIRPLFETQLEACGVDYFDFYLMHGQNHERFQKCKNCGAYDEVIRLKEEGKIHHFGISFHDTAEVLDQILTESPQIELVQIQFNYLDYDDPAVQSRLLYETCRKHGKPMSVMEPIKGGKLINLPEAAQTFLTGGSNASYALRFAAGFEGIAVVLSGMSTLGQMEENISFMKDFKPLDDDEQLAVAKVRNVLENTKSIPCTGCRYCVDENTCPMNILIPDIFALLNRQHAIGAKGGRYYFDTLTANGHGKADDCIRCGGCEEYCPQHLPIRKLLEEAAKEFGQRPF